MRRDKQAEPLTPVKGDVEERLHFVGRRVPPSFELRVVTLAPGRMRLYEEGEWRDALVVVERGEIELECTLGSRSRFLSGAVLWLMGLPLRALHNPGREPALLVAIWRAKCVDLADRRSTS